MKASISYEFSFPFFYLTNLIQSLISWSNKCGEVRYGDPILRHTFGMSYWKGFIFDIIISIFFFFFFLKQK